MKLTTIAAALISATMLILSAVAIGATKLTKQPAPPYCPPGQSVVDSKAPEYADIRKTAMAFTKLDFDGVRGGPNEGKYHSLIPASTLRKNKGVFPPHLDSAEIRGYRWSHACVGERDGTAWIRIDVAYFQVSTVVKTRPDEFRTEQRYYDAERGTMVDALEGGTLLYRYPRKHRFGTDYDDYVAPPQRYYFLPLQLVAIEDEWLVKEPQQVRQHFRVRTPIEERRIKSTKEKRCAIAPGDLYCWNKHDEAILQMIVSLTKPAFKN